MADNPFQQFAWSEGGPDTAPPPPRKRARPPPLHPCWSPRLDKLTKPASREMEALLDRNNTLGMPAAKLRGSFAAFVLAQKRLRPTCVILVRKGDFYEAMGVDAIMLVEHTQVNPHRCRATQRVEVAMTGVPSSNLHSTLERLVEQELRVAVYEEVHSFGNISRVMTQVVSPCNPSYIHGGSGVSLPAQVGEGRPLVAVRWGEMGHTLWVVSVPKRAVQECAGLSTEVLRARLQLLSPLVLYTQGVPAAVVREHRHLEVVPLEGYADMCAAVLQHVESEMGVPAAGFRRSADADLSGSGKGGRPQPLHLWTAHQLGVLKHAGVPSLVDHLVEPSAPAACRAWLREWLLAPPAPASAERMRSLCRALGERGAPALPVFPAVSPHRLSSLVHSERAGADLFSDAAKLLRALLGLRGAPADLALRLARERTGLWRESAGEGALREALARLERVLPGPAGAGGGGGEDDPAGAIGDCSRHPALPRDWLERNEHAWRGVLHPDLCRDLCARVAAAVGGVAGAVAASERAAGDRAGGVEAAFAEQPRLRYHTGLNLLAWSAPAGGAASAAAASAAAAAAQGADDHHRWRPVRDRRGQPVRGLRTTGALEAAQERYLALCDRARQLVREHHRALCRELLPRLPSFHLWLEWARVCTTAWHHAAAAAKGRWALSEAAAPGPGAALCLEGAFPYWLPSGVRNDVTLDRLQVLTSPNASGKSTLLRTVGSAALLGMCGLHVPARKAVVPSYHLIYFRTASSDDASQGLSSMALEMRDLRTLVHSSHASLPNLVLTDELAKGTSSHEGSCFFAALLEWMDKRPFHAILATHLYEALDLPYRCDRLRTVRMRVTPRDDPQEPPVMRYTLERGRCGYSMALALARQTGLPAELVRRQAELERHPRGRAAAAAAPAPAGDPGGVAAPGGAVVEARLRGALLSWAADREVCRVSLAQHPPARLSCASVLYVISSGSTPPMYYVGETDNIVRRHASHSERLGRRGHMWLVEVRHKSEARLREASLIRMLKAWGCLLESDSDGNHSHFGSVAGS